MRRAFGTTMAHGFRRVALPLASYHAVTLALPLANGAAQSGSSFVGHALMVLIIPPALILVACMFCTTIRLLPTAFRRLGTLPRVTGGCGLTRRRYAGVVYRR